MTAYAVAHLRSVTLGPDITGYLERIDSTLAPSTGGSWSTEPKPKSWKAAGPVT